MAFKTGTHHCAVFHGSQVRATDIGYSKCELHPGHEDFMTVDEFLNKDPSDFGLNSENDVSDVRSVIDNTVRIVVHHTSVDRPDTFMNSKTSYPCIESRGNFCSVRYGTGCLVHRKYEGDDGENDDNDNVDGSLDVQKSTQKEERCPCSQCRKSRRRTQKLKSHYFLISTATHVIFDQREAQYATFEFFYDSEDSVVEKVYGVNVLHSRHQRLQTDRCFVMCVTHDDGLAEKLGVLRDQWVSLRVDNIMVSHPHGVSKKITVNDKPEVTILVAPNKTCVKLKKDTKIRFPGCHDTAGLVQDINRVLGTTVIGRKWFSKTLVLRCDLTVFRPEGIVVETSKDEYFDSSDKPKTKVWWDFFSADTQLKTDDGKVYTCPYKDGEVTGVKMEALEKIQHFFDKNDQHSMFICTRYKIASCPGSSGAHIKSFGRYFGDAVLGQVHFGSSNSGDCNSSSLVCIHSPDDDQEAETHPKGWWPHDIGKKYKQLLVYDMFIGKNNNIDDIKNYCK